MMISDTFLYSRMQMLPALPTMFIVFLVFLLPSSYSFFNHCSGKKSVPTKSIQSLLIWDYVFENMPWSLMFVVGGGFAIGQASKSTKLVQKLAADLLGIKTTTKPLPLLIFEVVMLSTFLTAFASNVSIADQMIHFVAEVCYRARKHPILVFYPSILACNMAFHLPVSTPPNAIACGYGNIRNKDIVRFQHLMGF